MSAMDPLSEGSRPGRLPSLFVGRASGIGRGPFLRRCAGVAAVTSGLALVGSAVPASATTYRARDGASLKAAVISADASGGPSTIELTAGAILPTSTLIISRDVTIVGPSSAPGAKLAGSAVEPFPSDLILVEAHAKLTLRDVELTTGGGAGSAAAIDDAGVVDLESSTVAGNDGSGLLVQPGATAIVRNSTLSDGLDFGLIDQGTASLFNSTVAGNADGGVDDSAGMLNLTNTIVAKNRSSDCTKRAAASDHSLDSDGSCGAGALSRIDPGLGKLTANGGPTSTQALSAGSPAIGAGNDSKCLAEDQRHFARPAGRCDIGAFETGAVQGGARAVSPGTGPGSGRSQGGAAAGIAGVNGHGTLRGARRSRITFTVRAEVRQSHAKLFYADRARHVLLRALAVSSLAIDGQRGIATLRGRGTEMPSKRRVSITIVLVSHSGHRTLRIRLSSGYYDSGRLLNGSITLTRSVGRSSQINRRRARCDRTRQRCPVEPPANGVLLIRVGARRLCYQFVSDLYLSSKHIRGLCTSRENR